MVILSQDSATVTTSMIFSSSSETAALDVVSTVYLSALLASVMTVSSWLLHSQFQKNYNSSIGFPWRAILEGLILRIALAAGAIFSSILPALLGVNWKINSQ